MREGVSEGVGVMSHKVKTRDPTEVGVRSLLRVCSDVNKRVERLEHFVKRAGRPCVCNCDGGKKETADCDGEEQRIKPLDTVRVAVCSCEGGARNKDVTSKKVGVWGLLQFFVPSSCPDFLVRNVFACVSLRRVNASEHVIAAGKATTPLVAMGSYLSEPITHKETECCEGSHLYAATASMQGYRVDQEDAHLLTRIRGGEGRYVTDQRAKVRAAVVLLTVHFCSSACVYACVFVCRMYCLVPKKRSGCSVFLTGTAAGWYLT